MELRPAWLLRHTQMPKPEPKSKITSALSHAYFTTRPVQASSATAKPEARVAIDNLWVIRFSDNVDPFPCKSDVNVAPVCATSDLYREGDITSATNAPVSGVTMFGQLIDQHVIPITSKKVRQSAPYVGWDRCLVLVLKIAREKPIADNHEVF